MLILWLNYRSRSSRLSRALPGTENLDLSDVGVTSGLLVLEDGYLNVHGLDCGPIAVVKGEDVPAERLHELYHFDLLQLVEAVSDANRYFLRRVALICLEVQVEG